MTVVVAFILEAFLFRMQYRHKMHGLDMDGTLSLLYFKTIFTYFILIWPIGWTPAVGGLFVCLCVRGHVAILLGA